MKKKFFLKKEELTNKMIEKSQMNKILGGSYPNYAESTATKKPVIKEF